MLKAVVAYSKKVPAETEYSSQGYSLSLETEIPETDSKSIQARLHTTFELVKTSVEQELQNGNGHTVAKSAAQPAQQDMLQAKATNRQIKYLTDLARERNITLAELNAEVRKLYGVDGIYSLSKADASKLVESLKRDQPRKAA